MCIYIKSAQAASPEQLLNDSGAGNNNLGWRWLHYFFFLQSHQISSPPGRPPQICMSFWLRDTSGFTSKGGNIAAVGNMCSGLAEASLLIWAVLYRPYLMRCTWFEISPMSLVNRLHRNIKGQQNTYRSHDLTDWKKSRADTFTLIVSMRNHSQAPASLV